MSIKTKIIITVILIALLIGGIFLFFQKDKFFSKDETERLHLNFINEGEKIEVLDSDNIVYSLEIEDFRVWAKENWSDIFEEKPAFGDLREVEIDNFYNFNNTAIISPLDNHLAFSVSDYAALTDISFIGIVNLNNKELSLINKENIGAVQSMLFSPEENYIAYTLDTARAKSDYLTVDSVISKTKEITISEKNILNVTAENCEELHPQFSNLYFRNDNELYFTALNCSEEKIEWILNIENKEIKQKNIIN